MAGRASAFADPEIVRLAQDEFVPVTADDWYQRRRQDAEGAFFMRMSDQTGRKASGKTGTRQGIYCLTADGEALAMKNAGDNAAETLKQLKQALAKFEKLPANRRTPGAVTVPAPGKPDPNFARTLPPGGLAVKVNGRILDRAPAGFKSGTCDFPGGTKSGRDFLWLKAAEVEKLLPPRRDVGVSYAAPASVVTRLCRHHLTDFTRGEPPSWDVEHVRRSEITLTVTTVTPTAIELRLDGTALMATDADAAKAERGYDARLTGRLTYDIQAKTFTRFDVAAVGEHWGEGPHTGGARPGRTLLGVTLGPVVPADGSPSDRVPPQAARDLAEYFGTR